MSMLEITKKRDGTRRVVFLLPDGVDAQRESVVGDFNGWDALRHPMKRSKGRPWRIAVDLPTGEYQFRYLVNETDWYDEDSVGRCPNPFGGENGLLILH